MTKVSRGGIILTAGLPTTFTNVIGKVCEQKHQQYREAIMPPLRALASLGSATQMGSFLFAQYGQGSHFHCLKVLTVLQKLPVDIQVKRVFRRHNMSHRGAQYLTGENLKVVWAEFSTLS